MKGKPRVHSQIKIGALTAGIVAAILLIFIAAISAAVVIFKMVRFLSAVVTIIGGVAGTVRYFRHNHN